VIAKSCPSESEQVSQEQGDRERIGVASGTL
jgi:hypothetical protein